MQTRTTRPEDTGPINGDTEIKTVRTRQRVGGAPLDDAAASRAVSGEGRGSYLQTLPERLRAVVMVVLIALEACLGIRFLLLAYGANTTSGFAGFIDDASRPLVRPFANAFSNRAWDQGIIEISTLVAMAVYLLGFVLIAMLVTALAPRLSRDTAGAG